MEITKNEENLIKTIRTRYRYGEIIIIIHEGVPIRIKKVETFTDLRGDLSKTNELSEKSKIIKRNGNAEELSQ
jgi:hypothetical protein